MKVIPSNQTLILSGERGPSGDARIGALPRAMRNAAGEAVLQRVTLVASRPDATLLYFQADYSSTTQTARRTESSADTAGAVTAGATAKKSGMPARMAPAPPRGHASRSSRGIELYASTQRMRTESPPPQIDVLA